jgi:hypothetical protein
MVPILHARFTAYPPAGAGETTRRYAMAVDLASVQTGMEVLDLSGEKIGTVADILNVQPYAVSGSDQFESDPGTGTVGDLQTTTVMRDPSGEQTYLKVEQGGFLGIGATDLYVPFRAVQRVIPGDSLTVACMKDTCGNMFGTKPDFLP